MDAEDHDWGRSPSVYLQRESVLIKGEETPPVMLAEMIRSPLFHLCDGLYFQDQPLQIGPIRHGYQRRQKEAKYDL